MNALKLSSLFLHFSFSFIITQMNFDCSATMTMAKTATTTMIKTNFYIHFSSISMYTQRNNCEMAFNLLLLVILMKRNWCVVVSIVTIIYDLVHNAV